MGNRPSWTGGAAAAKPQPGWLFRILRNAPWIFLSEKSINHMEIISVIEQPPRRFAPPLLSRRGDRPMSCKYVLASELAAIAVQQSLRQFIKQRLSFPQVDCIQSLRE